MYTSSIMKKIKITFLTGELSFSNVHTLLWYQILLYYFTKVLIIYLLNIDIDSNLYKFISLWISNACI